jgi:hypothetical protein
VLSPSAHRGWCLVQSPRWGAPRAGGAVWGSQIGKIWTNHAHICFFNLRSWSLNCVSGFWLLASWSCFCSLPTVPSASTSAPLSPEYPGRRSISPIPPGSRLTNGNGMVANGQHKQLRKREGGLIRPAYGRDPTSATSQALTRICALVGA